MAWTAITYRCGHQTEVQMGGPRRAREYRVQQLERRQCAACVEAERVAAAERAREDAEREGLPALTGSPRQIVWAEQIRGGLVTALAAARAAGEMITVPALEQESRAGWWIDNRRLVKDITDQAARSAARASLTLVTATA